MYSNCKVNPIHKTAKGLSIGCHIDEWSLSEISECQAVKELVRGINRVRMGNGINVFFPGIKNK